MSNRILTTIFDMDGVILDSERVYQAIERSMYTELDIPVSKEEQLRFMGTAERSIWTSICKKYSIEESVEDLVREERERFIKQLEKPGGIPLINGLIPLLKTLQSKSIPCWIASSSSSDIIARVLRINDLENFYKGFVSGDDVVNSKPSPEIFLKAAKLSGTDPSNCLVIEDSLNGVLAAKAAGMKVIALQLAENNLPDFTKADEVVSDLHDIIEEFTP